MNCSSEPGVIAAGAGALPGARRRCEAGKRTCLALLAATALLALAAPAQAQTEIWSATLTPQTADVGAIGCDSNDSDTADQCSNTSVLSDNNFTLDSTDHTIWILILQGGSLLNLSLAPALTDVDTLVLVLGTTSLAFSDATSLQSGRQFLWSGTGLSWTAGTDVSVSLISLTAPDAPTGLAATANGQFQIDLAWTAPASTGGSAITGYKIEFSPDGTSWSDLVADTASTATAYTHTGLNAATTRHYRVSAINAVDTSDPSGTDDATTEANTITAQTEMVPADWALKPADIAAGEQFRLMFVTSTGRDALSTDIADYNTFVRTRAAAGVTAMQTYANDFTALASTESVNARANTLTRATDTDVPIYWVRSGSVGAGDRATDDYADFYDATWKTNAIGRNESGVNISFVSTSFWTGTNTDGTTHATQFMGATGSGARVIRWRVQSSSIVTSNSPATSSSYRIAALSPVFQVAGGTTNTAAMGAPTITGTAQVGKTLTAVTTGITDADGLTSPTYTYQWIRVDGTDEEDISGENSSTYTLDDADLGKTIKVKVSFEDDASNSETLTSAATATVAADTTPPEVVSVTVASTGSDVYLVFDEGLDGTAGAALPSSAFSLTVAGQAVTIHNYNFHEAEMTLTVQSGTIKQGQTVVVSYTDPTAGDDTVALQDSAGNDVASFTTGMSGVPAVTNNSTNTAAMGAPTITGTAQVGQTLTAATTGITDSDGLTSATYTYQWIRVDGTDEEDISGENSSTYTLVDADLGKTIKVKVTFTDDASNAETLTSAATVTVAADTTPPEVESVTVNSTGSTVTLVFDEHLDDAAAGGLHLSAISLTAGGQAVTAPFADFNLQRQTLALTYRYGRIKQGQTVVFSYTDPTAGDDTDTLQDVAGNDVASFTTGMSGVPAVTNNSTNNAATGEPAISGTAQVGQTLTAATTGITDSDGLTSATYTYQWLRVDSDGTSNEEDIYAENAATYTLTDDDVGKRIKVRVSFIDELSGVEMRTSAAYPSSGTVTAASTTAPALLSVTVTSTPHKTTDTYGAREHIEFSMTFDAPVTVTGDPTFAFDLGGASTASYYAGSGTATLRFSHAVTGGTSGDRDTNGISWAQNAIALNGGTIAGTDNAVVAVLTHVAQSNLAAHKVDGRTTPVTPATVTDVVVTSTPMLMASGSTTADTYGFGETIVITVTVSDAVEVVGDPGFRFNIGNPGSTGNVVEATYDRTRSIATTIVFTYTVQAADMDTNGFWIGPHSQTFLLDANDRIRTASQQINIDRTHTEESTQDGHKVDGSLGAPTVPPDPTAPTLVLATATTLTIEWTHPGDGGSPLTRNFIEYRVEGTTDWTNWYRGETPTQVTRTVITNLAAATAYDVRVHATNAIGNSQWVQSATAFSTLAGTAATGAPTITGTAAVGQPLAVDLTGIGDADGLTNVSYTYQWIRVDADGTSNPADIADETDATYTLVDADLGKTLKVRVTFDDDDGNTETLTSAATATVTPAAGVPGSPIILSVTVGVGQVVLVWKDPPLEGIDLTHYEYRSSPGDMILPDAMWQQVLSSPGTINQAYFQVVKGLTSGTIHTLQVRAGNTQGGSAPTTVTATPVSQPSCTIDELGDRRLLLQGQLTAGVREVFTDGNVHTGYGKGGEETGTLTSDAFTFRSTTYSVVTWTSEDRLTVILHDPGSTTWYPREEVVDALRLHVCNTPYDFSDATPRDIFSQFSGYRWNVGFNWPPGIERTLRLSLPPNHPATGDPVISGTVQVAEELTALTDGIMDDDVLDDVFTYQWVRVDADGTSNEEDITDATDATYTLTADERGKQVKVAVRFVDILGGEETRTSAPTATLAGVPNTPATGAPTITGTAQVGQTLTAVTTGIMDADGLTSPTYTYQWIRVDGTEADIAGENSSTYILGDADLGTTLKVRVTFADDLGHTETLTSAATATVGAVATGPPTVTEVAVTSTPASGTTYYLADEVIEFTVTFSAPVTVTATPKFAFRLGAATRQAAYASGSDSAALVFARTVQAGEVDRNGISWNALALALDGGTITRMGATTAASLTHAEQANLEGHRVDAAPPMQVSASVHGMSLVLVYDEPLDPASMPATGAYTVTATVGATTTNPAVSEVSIYGIWVTLALDAAPAAGATVTLAYAPPASNPVQDEAGNDAPAFSGQSVRLGPPPPDLEQVMGVGVVPGNAQLVVTWTAVDNATGYTVQWTSGSQAYNTGDRQATVTSGTTTSHTITGLANGTEYTVQVSATRTGANDGPPSDEMTGTPTAPTAAGIAVSTAALTVTEQDSTGDGYTVVLDTEPTADVVVTVAGHVGSDVTANPTALTFTMSNWETAQTVTVTAGDDADTTDDSVALTHSAASADSGYSGIAIAGVAVTVNDNDTAQVMGVSVAPGNAQLVVTWTAVDNATGYTVQWTSGSQAYNTGDRQATVTSGTTTSHTITGLANGTEYTVQVSATRTGANDGPPSDEMTGTPTAPTAAGIAVSTAALTVTEQDSTGDGYTVVLDTEPTADVVVTVAGHVGSDVTANPTALTFTMSNWETAQTVTVTAGDDADTTDDSVALTHSAASADSGYSGIAIAGVAVTVNDNDTAQVMGVGVVPGNAQLVVTWTAVDNATGYTVQWTSGSQAYNTGDRQATVTSGTTTSHTITGLANGTEYTVQVSATRTGANDGPPSDEMTGTPTAPTAAGIAVSTAALTVTEQDSTGDGYTVVLDTEPTADVVVTVAGHVGSDVTANPTALTFTMSNWETAQTVTVTAGDDADTTDDSVALTHSAASADSGYSGIAIAGVAVTVNDNDTAQVLGVSVVPGNAQLVVTWTAVDNATGYTVQWTSGSQAYNSGDRQATVTSGTTTSHTITGLANGTEYTVQVSATRTGANDGPPSAEVTASPFTTPPPPPPPVTDLAQVMGVTVAPGNAHLVVTWTAVSTATGYTVQWKSGGQGYNTGDRQATVTSGTTSSHTITGLANGTEYTVQVSATRTGANDGPPSDEMTGTPTAPTAAGIAVSTAALTVTEQDSTGDGYTVVLDTEPTADVVVTVAGHVGSDVTANPTALTFTMSNWETAQTVTVTAGDDADTTDDSVALTHSAASADSGYSGIAIAGVAVTVNDNDTAQVMGVGVVPGNAQLVVTWTAVDNATGYTVQWTSGSQAYNTGDRQATVTSRSTTSHTITGLANGTEYTVQVSATRTGANDGPPSDEMTGTPTVPPPPPPDLAQVMGVTVAPGNAQLVVTWTAVSTATGYTVQWTSGSQAYNTGDRQATVTSGSTTRYTIPSLTNGTPYTVRVIATRTGANDGPPSSEVTASPVTTPGAPQHLSAVPGYEQVTLTWDAPSSDGGSAILRYEVAVDDSGTWIDAGLDLEETVTGLTNGQRYTFAVRAVNAAGTGPAATVTIVTSNPLPQAWLARFGRAATDHVVDAVSSRWQGGPQASHLTIGGGQTGALFGWIGRVGQAARDTADDRGDPVRTETSWTRLFAPFGGAGTGGGGTGPGMTVTDRNTGPVGLGGVDRKAGATLSGRAAQGALLGALGLPDPRALTDLRAALLGSSFFYSGAGDEDGQPRTPGRFGEWSAWGRGAASWFSGTDSGLSLDGEVVTAMLGLDSRWERWLAGVVVSHSRGQGTYTHPTATGGAVASSLTALHPYAGYKFNERTSIWGVLGYGVGEMSLTPERSVTALETGLMNAMAAVGGRMALSVRSGPARRFELAIRSDARLTNTAADGVGAMAGAAGQTHRVRMMLEGSGVMPLASGGVLKPRLEAGLRYDAGDAETGAGLEVGGGLGYAAGRLSLEVNARGLLAHRDTQYEEWGFSGAVAYTPSKDGRGVSLRLGSGWGATQSGVQSLWRRQDASDLVRHAEFDAAQRYQVELRYGLDGLKGRVRWTPYIGVESVGGSSQALRLGVTLTSGRRFDAGLELGRRQGGPGAGPEHAGQIRVTLLW